MKFKNKFSVVFARYGHFTVDPNIDPDPKKLILILIQIFFLFCYLLILSKNSLISLQISNVLHI
jgi:hypothetical protein